MHGIVLVSGCFFVVLAIVLGIAAIVLFVLASRKRATAPRAVAQPPVAPPPVASPPAAPPPVAPPPIYGDETIAVTLMRYRIEWISGPLAGMSNDIPEHGLTIGRAAAVADIVLPDPSISKRHLRLGWRGDSVVATDAGSTNGTFFGSPQGERITERVLHAGDVLVFAADVARLRLARA